MGELVLLYDDDCGFCRWSVTKILAWDRVHRMKPHGSSSTSTPISGWGPPTSCRPTDVCSCGAIAEPLFRSLPVGRPLAALARAMPRTTEHTYRLVARNRQLLGRRFGVDACSAPSRSSDHVSPK